MFPSLVTVLLNLNELVTDQFVLACHTVWCVVNMLGFASVRNVGRLIARSNCIGVAPHLFRPRTAYQKYPALNLQLSQFSAGPDRDSKEDEKKQDVPPTEVSTGSGRMGMFASAGMAVSLLAGKSKYVFAALKLTKAMPLASMVLTSLTYSLFFGWQYSVGMVGLIFFHECGHAIVMHRYGVPFSPMVFVPFMGAVIAMKEEPRNAHDEAMIAFGGPVAGSVAALGCGLAAVATDSQLLYALADFGFMVNLFNLLPIGSLDGGRITNAVSPYFGVAGLAAGGAMIYADIIHNPIFYLIMLGGTYTTGMRVFGYEEKENKDYYKIPRSEQTSILAGYVGLVMALLYAMKENNKKRKTPKQLQAEKENPYDEVFLDPWDEGTNPDGVYDDFFKVK